MKKSIQKKRVITKILKLDENNQYGFGMTKPFPIGCIKQDLDTSWKTFNLLLQKILASIIELVTFMWLILYFIKLRLQKNKQFIMRFILQLLKNKCLLIHVKGQSISCLKNILRQKKEIQKHIKQLKKIMQPYFKKKSTHE